MPDVVNVGMNASSMNKSVALLPYSKVIINVDENTSYEAGNDTGLTMEIDIPYGTQEMANNILAKLTGYQYQPYEVTDGLIDPSAELGDAVATNGVYGGLYCQDSFFSHQFVSDYSAPHDEQLDHEFTYESSTERKVNRNARETKAEFKIVSNAITQEVTAREEQGEEFRGMFQTQADEISAKVSQVGGVNSSFGWTLVSNAFTLYSGNKSVFTCDSSGITVDGQVKARSGYIGTDANGFSIQQKSISNGKTSYNDENNGVYLGTDGIGLGAGKFSVSRTGELVAKSATLTGSIVAKSGQIGADADGVGGFEISSKNIHNGLSSLSGTTEGIYLGTDGIAVYKDESNNFRVQKSTGRITVRAGMTGRDDESNMSGMYLGYDGIALGGGRFKVTNAGALTAKSGTIAGWDIGNSMLSKQTVHDGVVTGYVGMSTSGSYAFFASNSDSINNAPFRVTTDGKVYLTKLYATQVKNPDADPSEWEWETKEVNLFDNSYKISSGYSTIRSVSADGTVRLSNGTSFKTATSVKVEGGWSGAQFVAKAYTEKNGIKLYTGAQIKSEVITSQFNGWSGSGSNIIGKIAAGYMVDSPYGGGAKYFSPIEGTEKQYKFGYSTTSANFDASTKIQIQNIDGTRNVYAPEFSLTAYWDKANETGWHDAYNMVNLPTSMVTASASMTVKTPASIPTTTPVSTEYTLMNENDNTVVLKTRTGYTMSTVASLTHNKYNIGWDTALSAITYKAPASKTLSYEEVVSVSAKIKKANGNEEYPIASTYTAPPDRWDAALSAITYSAPSSHTLSYSEVVDVLAKVKKANGNEEYIIASTYTAPIDRYSTGYNAGWGAAYDKVYVPTSPNTGGSISVGVPPSTVDGTTDTYTYSLSVDSSYAYIKYGSTTVARTSNTGTGTTLTGLWSNGTYTVTASPQGKTNSTTLRYASPSGNTSRSGKSVSRVFNIQYGPDDDHLYNTGYSPTITINASDVYNAGWGAAYDKVYVPTSPNTGSGISVGVPPSTVDGTTDTYTYTLSTDNNYAYLKYGDTTVARVTNSGGGSHSISITPDTVGKSSDPGSSYTELWSSTNFVLNRWYVMTVNCGTASKKYKIKIATSGK